MCQNPFNLWLNFFCSWKCSPKIICRNNLSKIICFVFGSKFFGGQKTFCTKELFGSKKILCQKNLGRKSFWVKKVVGSKNFGLWTVHKCRLWVAVPSTSSKRAECVSIQYVGGGVGVVGKQVEIVRWLLLLHQFY